MKSRIWTQRAPTACRSLCRVLQKPCQSPPSGHCAGLQKTRGKTQSELLQLRSKLREHKDCVRGVEDLFGVLRRGKTPHNRGRRASQLSVKFRIRRRPEPVRRDGPQMVAANATGTRCEVRSVQFDRDRQHAEREPSTKSYLSDVFDALKKTTRSFFDAVRALESGFYTAKNSGHSFRVKALRDWRAEGRAS